MMSCAFELGSGMITLSFNYLVQREPFRYPHILAQKLNMQSNADETFKKSRNLKYHRELLLAKRAQPTSKIQLCQEKNDICRTIKTPQ